MSATRVCGGCGGTYTGRYCPFCFRWGAVMGRRVDRLPAPEDDPEPLRAVVRAANDAIIDQDPDRPMRQVADD